MRWLDARSGRQVWLVEDWPDAPPWPCAHFALLVADRELDAIRALAQGLAAVEAWGPDCVAIERAFDEAVRDRVETAENVLITTSSPDQPFDASLAWFLDVLEPATDYAATCQAWVIYGDRELVERALAQRGARSL